MKKPRKIRKLLAAASNGDGPWTPVRNARRISVRNATREDVVQIVRQDEGVPEREPITITGSQTVEIMMAKGEMALRRIAGESYITAFVECE